MNYFFGCWNDKGHFLYDSSGRMVRDTEAIGLPDWTLDNLFNKKDIEFFTKRYWLLGYTFVSFTDYSIDKRPGSHSIFILSGYLDNEQALQRMREVFPSFSDRISRIRFI